jgi:hypothetical protein
MRCRGRRSWFHPELASSLPNFSSAYTDDTALDQVLCSLSLSSACTREDKALFLLFFLDVFRFGTDTFLHFL